MNKPVKTLHLYKDFYPPVVGGIEKIMNFMVTRLHQDPGYEVQALVCNRLVKKTVTEEYEGIPVTKAGEWFRFQSAPFSPAYIKALSQIKADLYHFHFPSPTSEIAALFSNVKAPWVVTYHSDIVRQKAALKIYGPLMHRFLKRCRIIMPTSRRYLESSPILQKHSSRCRVVPLGMDPTPFERTPQTMEQAARLREKYGTPIILFAGVFRYYKGIHVLLEAFRHLQYPASLVMIGSGPLKHEIEETVKTIPELKGRVFLPGEVPEHELPWYYHAADIFVLPSLFRSEAYGLCQIEAQFCGKPIVSTNLDTGVPFINIHGETGLIVPPGDTGKLKGALDTLLENPQKAKEMGQNGFKRATRQFTLDIMMDLIKNVYQEAIQRER